MSCLQHSKPVFVVFFYKDVAALRSGWLNSPPSEGWPPRGGRGGCISEAALRAGPYLVSSAPLGSAPLTTSH